MKKAFSTLLLLTAFVLQTRAETGVIITTEGEKIETDIVGVDDSGTVSYRDGKVTTKMKASQYEAVRLLETPDEVKAADKALEGDDFAKAAAMYKKACEKYKMLGYEIYCVAGEGNALLQANKPADAITVLEVLKAPRFNKNLNEYNTPDFMRGLQYLCEALILQNRAADAEQVVNEFFPKDERKPAALLMGEGQMYEKQGKTQLAILSYMRVALLYPKKLKQTRAKAMYKAAELMKSLNDRRWEDWKRELAKDYPNSPYLGKL